MFVRAPRSTLFPYTTLFRSQRRSWRRQRGRSRRRADGRWAGRRADGRCLARSGSRDCDRSEEHTSELQSLRHLVCRLLLEKKKILIVEIARYIDRRTTNVEA